MAANGVKKEEELLIINDPKPILLLDDHDHENIIINHEENNQNNNDDDNNNKKGISIAERRASKCGFNAANINTARSGTTGLIPQARSGAAYFTIPSGISPSALLDSPVLLPNAQAQLSPTTGTFQFPSSPNHESLKLKLKLASNGDNDTVAMEAQGVPHNLRVENKPLEELDQYPRDLQEMTKEPTFEGTTLAKTDQCVITWQAHNTTRNPIFTNNTNIDQISSNIKERGTNNPNHQEKQNHQKGSYFHKEVAKYSEDGFYWRKYGQKHVKGSEYPRSYYKCTNTNCPVKKKVERSHDGQITEIVYKGSHNHPKPQPFKRFGENSDQMNEGTSGSCFKSEGAVSSTGKLDVSFSADWRPDHSLDNGTSSTSLIMSDFSDHPTSRSMNTFESVDQTPPEFSSTFGSQECDDVQNNASPESISFNDEDDENGECEPKKRKRESFSNETNILPRSTREPRVVVQIESDIDILDDGYRWRKYGQKVVKGNPNPRSYYKCTTPGCPVRKHVERAANDIKSVITTYEGKHNHEVPSSKTGSLVISDVANLPPAVTNSTINSIPSQMGQKHDHHQITKTGKQVQDLPLYLERKPILNYNELMRSNLPGNFPSDLSFGNSSVYPLSFPPFHSLPYTSLLMNNNNNNNNNHLKGTTYNLSSNLYPVLPDYMSLQSQISHVNPGSANVGSFHFNNYAGAALQGHEIAAKNVVKPKEEQRDEGELYDTCLSIPNHGNGTI